MIWRIAAVGLLMSALGVVLAEMGFRGKRVFSALCVTMLLFGMASGVSEVFSRILGVADAGGVGEMARVALKVVGVGYVFGFVSDISEELGERGIASAVSAVGRVETVVLVLPYFLEICKIGTSLSG